MALSTAEAVYVALSSATQEAMWLRRLTAELRCKPSGATVIHEDNQSAITMAHNTVFMVDQSTLISDILSASKFVLGLSNLCTVVVSKWWPIC